MRKYAMPKFIYVIVALLVVGLSIGCTYAYFSAVDTASSNAQLGNIDIIWLNGSSAIEDTYTGEARKSIVLSTTLTRGEYSRISVGESTHLSLRVRNQGTVGAYCRLKVEAMYTHKDIANEEVTDEDWIDFDEGWLELAFALEQDGTTEMVVITEYPDGAAWQRERVTDEAGHEYDYYYYGISSNPSLLDTGRSTVVADHLYLADSASAAVLGATVKIILTLEGVQSANNAYQSVWGIS